MSGEEKKVLSVPDSIRERMKECPVCMQPFDKRIHQCKNSHFCCETCLATLRTTRQSRCAVCQEPVDGRAFMAEEMLAVLTSSCPNSGCHDVVSLSDQSKHAKECAHAPFVCGVATSPRCMWKGPSDQLFEHVVTHGGQVLDVKDGLHHDVTLTLTESIIIRIIYVRVVPAMRSVLLVLDRVYVRMGCLGDELMG